MLAVVSSDKKNLENLIEKYADKKELSSIGTEIYKCSYKEHEFVIAILGYGKVNTTLSLSYIIQKYNIKVIVNVGTAGSLSGTNEIFNAVIPRKVLSYDVDFCPLGFSPLMLPNMNKCLFETNYDLRNCFERACKLNGTNYSNDIVATGDMFVCNERLSSSIRRECLSKAVDFESGTIGQIAYQNNIPFVCIKIISNFASNNAVKEYRLYDEEARCNCQKIVIKFLKEYYE